MYVCASFHGLLNAFSPQVNEIGVWHWKEGRRRMCSMSPLIHLQVLFVLFG